MKYKRYSGGFNSTKGVAWRVEIWQENTSAFVVQEISFSGSPLEIEWTEVDKLEPVQSSKAVITLNSDSDRQFIDLYTISAGSVRLDVYRSNALYWSGTLDPELYEEPFANKKDYDVELTFSDFAILDRIKWDQSGFITLSDLIALASTQSQINVGPVDEYISTKINSSSTENLPDSICFNCSNFYDEDGEPMTLREVVNECLRPFSLRLIQKDGRLKLYDLNEVSTTFTPGLIEWASNDSVLGVDKVYNNVKVSFSPYEKTSLLSAEVERESIPTTLPKLIKTNYEHNDSNALIAPDGFNVYLSETAEGGVTKGSACKFFRFDPVFSGTEDTGVAYTFKSMPTYYNYITHLNQATNAIGGLALQANDNPYLANVGLNRDKYRLKLNLDLLFDTRYNPFEQAENLNENGDYEDLKNWCNFAYVPIMLTIRDVNGNALYHYVNKGIKDSDSYVNTLAGWSSGEGSWGDAYLAYYNFTNRKGDTGLGGWQTNKQIIGYYRSGLPSLYEKMPDGEFIKLPIVPGYLELKVGTGVVTWDYQREVKPIYDVTRWVMYKNPTIEITDKYGNDVNPQDIEHSAWLNVDAKEELKLDTVVGTLDNPLPSALGQIFQTTDKSVISSFYRAGYTDRLERLLIGTIYSNYASRHNVLSGTCNLLSDFGIYTDNNEPGKYILLSEVQNPLMDESNIKMVIVSPDNYSGVTFEN